MCDGIYRVEQSQVVKEKILNLTSKIIETYNVSVIENIYKPKEFLDNLLNDIKLSNLKTTIKGCVWNIVGILIGKFSVLLNDYKIEVHDVIFNDFKKILNQKKPEFKAIIGILKAYNYLLDDPHLKGNQINELYHYLKSIIHPLEDANTIKINKLALQVLSEHGNVFSMQLQVDCIELFNFIFSLCSHKNYELKITANEAIEKIAIHISDSLIEDNTLHKGVFREILGKIEEVLEKKSTSILTNTAISLIGIFSASIVRFLGENILSKYLEELIVICEKEVLYSIGKDAYKQAKQINYNSNNSSYSDPSSKYKPSKSIKAILSIQKQYISILNAYSNIISNLNDLSELFVKHFYSILLIGFSTYSKFYQKYKEKLTEAIAGIIVNMFKHQNFFWSFLRKIVKNGFVESIKITQNIIFKENAEINSMNNSIDFWILLLTRENSFTKFTVTKFFNQLMTEIFDLLESLEISYVEKVNENNNVYYEANNIDDLEIFIRTGKFLSGFIHQIKLNTNLFDLFQNWIIISLKHYMNYANDFPRIAISYSVLASIMKFCQDKKFFEGKSLNNDIILFKNEFYAFNMSLVKKIEIFQDDLLLEAIELLLSIPVIILKEIYCKNNNINILKSLYKKSFEIGFNDIRYSNLALFSLENLFQSFAEDQNENSKKYNDNLLNDILPIFGEYLLEYEKIKQSLIYSNDEMKNSKIENYTKIQNSIFDLLGSIGGKAHKIIQEKEDLDKNKNLIVNIINKENISYQFPLYNKKYNIYFDHLLTKICDISLNSMTKEKKFVSCELLHSIIIFIIGKNNKEMTNCLIYLMDKILLLACDLEKGICSIFETLLFQIIHWLSKKATLNENKDVIKIIDIIINASSSKKNIKLRELSSECLSEFIKWFIKQHSDFSVKSKISTIKYLIRKVESHSIHPDPFKRLGSAMCFEKILKVIVTNVYLIDKFLLEIFYYLLLIIKICHSSEELNEFIFRYCIKSINFIIVGVSKNIDLLKKKNEGRNIFKNLDELFQFLYNVMISNENESNFASQQFYVSLYKILFKGNSSEISNYWNNNNLWPKIENNDINEIAKYQFFNFLLTNKIISLNDIGFKYEDFSVEKLVNKIVETVKNMLPSNPNYKDKKWKIIFIYLINILNSNQEFSSPFLSIILTRNKDKENIIHLIFDIIVNSKEYENKVFIIKKYENLLSAFLNSVKSLIQMFCKIKSQYIISTIEEYLSTKCPMFCEIIPKNDSNNLENNFDNSNKENSKVNTNNLIANDFFFWLVTNDEICQKFSNKFKNILYENVIFLINHPNPNTLSLLKSYFTILFFTSFDKICDLLNQTQFYFDSIADSFLQNLTNDNYYKLIPNDIFANFIKNNCKSPEHITTVFIIFERCTFGKKINLIKLISKLFVENIIQFQKIDSIVNQIKIMTMILININDGNLKCDLESNINIYDIGMNVIDLYINQDQINIIKEILNLLGLIVKLNNYSDTKIKGIGDLFDKIKMKYTIIQSRYFPINTKCLVQNSKEWNNFQLIFDCLLGTFRTVKSFSFLEILFPILREEKSEYSIKVKKSIKEYIFYLISNNISEEIQKVIELFLERKNDMNPRDNIRFTLMKILVFKYLKKCTNSKIIIDLFLNNWHKIQNILNEGYTTLNNTGSQNFDIKFIIVLEKIIIYKFFKLIFDRIPSEKFKGEIHKRLIGENSKGNEITKYLISQLHDSKKRQIPGWEEIAKNVQFSEYEQDREVYINKVENNYYCSAYNCLCSLIKLTQTKVEVFNKFLFTTLRENGEKLFDLLISKNFTYNFPIETNFYMKELKSNTINDNTNNDNHNDNLNSKKSKILIDSLVSDSFFHDAYGTSIKENLTLSQKSFNIDFIEQIKKGISINFTNEENNNNNINLNNQIQIEEDYVNKHPIMESLLIILTYLYNNFPNSGNSMPSYLQILLNEMNRNDLSLNQKIFFIKVIINKIEIFEPYIKNFLPFLLKFSLEKNKCGIGFNYFLRDIATFILSCKNFQLEEEKSNIELISKYINTLIKLCGDTKNIIFRTNLKLVNDLMQKFKNLVYIDKEIILKMLNYPDDKKDSHIWKIIAVQVLASSIDYDIPLGDDLIYNKIQLEKSKFITSLENIPNITKKLIKLTDNNRTPVQSSTIELFGKILNYLESNNFVNGNQLYDAIFTCLNMKSISNEKNGVNTIFRTSIHYPLFISKKEIFNYCMKLIKKSSQKQKNLILNSLTTFITDIVQRILNKKSENELNDKSYITDTYLTLYQCNETLFMDPDNDLITNLINLLNQFLLLESKNFSDGIIKIIEKIQKNITNKEYNVKYIYYNYLIDCFNKSCVFDIELNKFILNMILINFDEEREKDLMEIFVNFLNNNNNNQIPNNPVDRLIYIIQNLNNNTIENEGKLIKILSRVILVLTYSSADYNLLLYENGLENCVYKDLNINTTGYYLNRSQPLTQSVIIRNSMDEAYENLVKASITGYNNSQIGGMIQATISGTSNINLTNTLNMLLNNSLNDLISNKDNFLSNNNSMDIINEEDSIPSNNNFNNNINFNYSNPNRPNLHISNSLTSNLSARTQKSNISNLTLTQREIILTTHSSLINSTINYPSMSTENKNVNFGFTHGEAFKVPYPVNQNKKKKNKRLGNLLSENELIYSPIDNSSQTRIRFVPEGSNRNFMYGKNKKNKNEQMIFKWLNRQSEIQKKQVKLLRKYRIGDLPDIQIKNKDILDPLISVCNNNEEISSELFLEIMISIYKESLQLSKNKEMEKSFENILKNNRLKNYLVVSSLHRVILSFMEINNNYIPNLDIIKETGLYSKNYHSSILIFEKCIENVNKGIDIETEQKEKNKIKKGIAGNDINKKKNNHYQGKCDININSNTQLAWAYLLKFYSKLKIFDTQIGLIQNFSIKSDYFINEGNDFLSHLTELITESKECLNRNIQKANLLKATFDIILEGQINSTIDSLKVKYNSSIFKDKSLKEVIEDYSLNSCCDLGEWEEIKNYLIKNKKNLERKEELIESSVLSIDEKNDNISQINTIMNSFPNEDENYSYFLSLFHAKKYDFDKAYLYYTKAKSNFYKNWLNLGDYSNNDLKHEIIKKIQMIYEIGEFLNFIRGTSATNKNFSNSSNNDFILNDIGTKNMLNLLENWLKRWPNYLYDEASSYQEIYSSRKILNDIMKYRIRNYEQIVSLNPVLETFKVREHIEIAKNLSKKNYLDFAEKHIQIALGFRKNNAYANSFIVYPVLKNKCELYEIESKTKSRYDLKGIEIIEKKYKKFIDVLETQIRTVQLDEETKKKILILQVKSHLSMTELNLNSGKNNFIDTFNETKKKFYDLEKTIDCHRNIKSYFHLLRPLIKFCDNVIRNFPDENLILNSNSEKIKFNNDICKLYMEYGLKILIENDIKMVNIIPKLLDILSKNIGLLKNIFLSYSLNVNINYYLKWKNQLLSYVNIPSMSELLFPIINNILKKEPQSLFYAFSTIDSYSEIFNNNSMIVNSNDKTNLYNYIKNYYSRFQHLNSMIEAFDCLTHPDQRLQFWLNQLLIIIKNHEKSNLQKEIKKMKDIMNAIDYDIINLNKKYIGNKVGSYNRKFSQLISHSIKSLNINNFISILTSSESYQEKNEKFNREITQIRQALKNLEFHQVQEGIEKLSTFSEWLSQYENNEFVNPENYIILPLSNNSNIKISSFDQHLTVLPSIRKPKKIKIFGNNEKSYSYLIKGSEDLRLDERIQEIFKVMNEILQKDSNCAKKKIKLNTFDVVPMTQKLGMIEWINNTQPLSKIIKYSIINLNKENEEEENENIDYSNWDLQQSKPYIARVTWYENLYPKLNLNEKIFKAFHSTNSNEIIKPFKTHENLMPKTILQKALMHYLLTPEEILTTRINFIRNYSALCIGCYILGIGDRHLENFLINIKNSEIVAIDFGVSFGQGQTQFIPELVPYRLSRQIKNVIFPFGIKGIIRQTMINVLSSFKINKDFILDYCEVFVKEPLLDWLNKNINLYENNNKNDNRNNKWLPMKKLDNVYRKLSGGNPIKIFFSEIEEGESFTEKTKEIIKCILNGNVDGIRFLNKDEDFVSVETQVDMMNEQATDPNLLGRMWIGWASFI